MTRTLRRIVAPTDAILSLAEAYAQLRLDTVGSPPTHPDDLLIAAEIDAITAALDAGTGWLGRALAPQTWRLGLSAFPAGDCGIYIPYPPLIEITGVEYTDDGDNTVAMIEGTDYRIKRIRDDLVMIAPMRGEYWPTDAVEDYDAVRVTFRCGYVTGSPETVAVPEQIKNVVRAVLTETYDTRGVIDNTLTKRGEVIERVINTLANIRVYEQ